MDLFTALAVIIPSTLSLVTSLIYAVIAIKKAKEPPKDEVWETALRLMCSKDDCYSSADDFANLYLQLKFFKDQPEKMKGFTTIDQAIDAFNSASRPQE